MGSTVLVVVSILALLAAGVHHYSMFSSEYALSTWQYGLAAYAPWIVLGFALVFIFSAIAFFFSGPEAQAKVVNTVSTPMEAIQEAVQNSMQIMPPANTATNPVTSAINTGIRTVANVTNTTKNLPKSSPNVPGLGYPASQV